MDVSIKIRENGDISWLKNMYEQLKNKDLITEMKEAFDNEEKGIFEKF